MAVRGTVDAGAGGTLVTSVSGTANQITVTPTTGTPVVSLAAGLSGQFPGLLNNTAAASGNVGQHITATVASGSPVTVSGATDITSIVLTPGVWMVYGVVVISPSGAMSAAGAWTNTTTASAPSLPDLSRFLIQTTFSAALVLSMPVGAKEYTVATAQTATVYLSTLVAGVGSITAYGTIDAIRTR